MKKALAVILMLQASIAQGYEIDLTVDQLLAESNVVVVGKLSKVKDWIEGDFARGEGFIEVSETLLGAIPRKKRLNLRWANRLYRSGAVEFEDTGDEEFVWFLWRVKDGSFRARYSSCKAPLDEKTQILAAIKKRQAEQGGAR
ncbi:MAG: hypothetical protein Q7Q71_06470 [Verrucomicrobiota bacterium JB023]|nr:hypothetical protein [Verrucomicrobiota bacterium JB023]